MQKFGVSVLTDKKMAQETKDAVAALRAYFPPLPLLRTHRFPPIPSSLVGSTRSVTIYAATDEEIRTGVSNPRYLARQPFVVVVRPAAVELKWNPVMEGHRLYLAWLKHHNAMLRRVKAMAYYKLADFAAIPGKARRRAAVLANPGKTNNKKTPAKRLDEANSAAACTLGSFDVKEQLVGFWGRVFDGWRHRHTDTASWKASQRLPADAVDLFPPRINFDGLVNDSDNTKLAILYCHELWYHCNGRILEPITPSEHIPDTVRLLLPEVDCRLASITMGGLIIAEMQKKNPAIVDMFALATRVGLAAFIYGAMVRYRPRAYNDDVKGYEATALKCVTKFFHQRHKCQPNIKYHDACLEGIEKLTNDISKSGGKAHDYDDERKRRGASSIWARPAVGRDTREMCTNDHLYRRKVRKLTNNTQIRGLYVAFHPELHYHHWFESGAHLFPDQSPRAMIGMTRLLISFVRGNRTIDDPFDRSARAFRHASPATIPYFMNFTNGHAMPPASMTSSRIILERRMDPDQHSPLHTRQIMWDYLVANGTSVLRRGGGSTDALRFVISGCEHRLRPGVMFHMDRTVALLAVAGSQFKPTIVTFPGHALTVTVLSHIPGPYHTAVRDGIGCNVPAGADLSCEVAMIWNAMRCLLLNEADLYATMCVLIPHLTLTMVKSSFTHYNSYIFNKHSAFVATYGISLKSFMAATTDSAPFLNAAMSCFGTHAMRPLHPDPSILRKALLFARRGIISPIDLPLPMDIPVNTAVVWPGGPNEGSAVAVHGSPATRIPGRYALLNFIKLFKPMCFASFWPQYFEIFNYYHPYQATVYASGRSWDDLPRVPSGTALADFKSSVVAYTSRVAKADDMAPLTDLMSAPEMGMSVGELLSEWSEWDPREKETLSSASSTRATWRHTDMALMEVKRFTGDVMQSLDAEFEGMCGSRLATDYTVRSTTVNDMKERLSGDFFH